MINFYVICEQLAQITHYRNVLSAWCRCYKSTMSEWQTTTERWRPCLHLSELPSDLCRTFFKSVRRDRPDSRLLLSSLWQWREWIHVVYVDDSRTIWQNDRLFLFHFPCSFKSLRVTCSFCNVIKKTESRWKHDQRFYHYVHPINYVSRAINQVCVEVSAWACKCVWESVMCVLGVKE